MLGRHRAARDGPARSCAPRFARSIERLRVRRFSPDEIQPFQRGFLGAAVAAGIPWTDDVDDLDGQVGCGSEPMNVVAGVRWNAAFAYLDPVRDHRELTIVADATVERVLIANGRAFGVQARVDGQPRELRADLVVLTAGAYGTPEILLRSGVGPAADLREHGIEFTRSASAAIGRPGGASGGRSCVPRRGSRCCGAGLRRPMGPAGRSTARDRRVSGVTAAVPARHR